MCANAQNFGRFPKSGGRCRKVQKDKTWHQMPTKDTSLSVRVMFSINITLAHLLDSLVRVSRRADEPHRGAIAISKPTCGSTKSGRRGGRNLRNRESYPVGNVSLCLPPLKPPEGKKSISTGSTRGCPEERANAKPDFKTTAGMTQREGSLRGTTHQSVVDSGPSLTS